MLMLKKIIIILITTFALTLNASASSDGELLLKKIPTEVKECWEGFNRASFSLNQGLDKLIFKPVASVYRNFPTPIKMA